MVNVSNSSSEIETLGVRTKGAWSDVTTIYDTKEVDLGIMNVSKGTVFFTRARTSHDVVVGKSNSSIWTSL